MMETELALNLIRTFGILIGVVIAVYEIINIQKTRKMEYLTRLSTTWTSYETNENWTDIVFQQFFSDVDEWRKYYSPIVNPEAASKLYAILNLFNNIGSLVKNNIVDLDFVLQSLSPVMIKGTWFKLKPLVEFWRDVYDYPEYYKMFEYLHDETLKKYPKEYVSRGEQYLEAQKRWRVERDQT
jgi:hypothetical protein